jgi:hypothetical protein
MPECILVPDLNEQMPFKAGNVEVKVDVGGS